MLYKIKKSLDDGWGKLRWFSSILSERIKVEIAVIKLLRESADLEKDRDRLVMEIGERVFELRASKDISIYVDPKVASRLKELEEVEGKLVELKSRATEIGEVE
jgi:hypothetical protein